IYPSSPYQCVTNQRRKLVLDSRLLARIWSSRRRFSVSESGARSSAELFTPLIASKRASSSSVFSKSYQISHTRAFPSWEAVTSRLLSDENAVERTRPEPWTSGAVIARPVLASQTLAMLPEAVATLRSSSLKEAEYTTSPCCMTSPTAVPSATLQI